MEQLFTTDNMVALVTLTALEIVLGIDNVVFIAILAGKLPENRQRAARRVGLMLAMFMRIGLLLAIGWVMGLTADLFSIPMFWTSEAGDAHGVTGRDLIMLLGGLFLIGKATYEIHDKLEGHVHGGARVPSSFGTVVLQIVLIDIVFSLDSVITAVGMVVGNASHGAAPAAADATAGADWADMAVMISAVVIAVFVMLIFAGVIAGFVQRHPTLKMLALSFLILIGVMLVADGFGWHIPKGYIYFGMAFSLAVELLNMRLRKVSAPVELHQSYVAESRQNDAT